MMVDLGGARNDPSCHLDTEGPHKSRSGPLLLNGADAGQRQQVNSLCDLLHRPMQLGKDGMDQVRSGLCDICDYRIVLVVFEVHYGVALFFLPCDQEKLIPYWFDGNRNGLRV